MALAGLWENWKSPEGEWIRSFAIVTTTPNELCARLHNQMPVVLKPEVWPLWLGEEPADVPGLKARRSVLRFMAGQAATWDPATANDLLRLELLCHVDRVA